MKVWIKEFNQELQGSILDDMLLAKANLLRLLLRKGNLSNEEADLQLALEKDPEIQKILDGLV